MELWEITEEQLNEAKKSISDEFMRRYSEWLEDVDNLSEREYGHKYGWCKSNVEIKDNLKAVAMFQKYMYNGRWLPEWEKAGYDRHLIWALSNIGWLSYQGYTNWNARAQGRTDFYYLSQERAKQIYKDSKSK